MYYSRLLLATIGGASVVSAAPSFDVSTVPAAAPLFSWFSTSLSQWTSSVKNGNYIVDEASEYAASLVNGVVNPFEAPDYKDKSIWQVIQENEHLTDLKRVLKYAGPKSKELLNDKSKKLTFLAPINWHHGKDHDEAALAQWQPIQQQIDELENGLQDLKEKKKKNYDNDHDDDDDDRKEKKRKAIAYLIDSTLKYHVIDSAKPLKASEIAQNSSVATLLHIGDGKAKEILGNLWDGEKFRLRVGKSLLPKPAAYFNFYSRLVYPDVQVSNSIVHAVSFPIFIPPSSLQTLFFAQNEFSALTSALQKVHVDTYLKLPINSSYLHHGGDHEHDHDHKHKHKSISGDEKHHEHHGPHHAHGVGAQTLFAPANLAWTRLPIKLRLFLFSPFGEHVLQLVLALHALPRTIFYADWVHQVGNGTIGKQYTTSASEIFTNFGETAFGAVNVTEYTFDTACPKLHHNKSSNVWTESKDKFETVDVKVSRYFLLPGEKGPLQTRVSVNEVPVLFQDIPSANGAIHQIENFIKPKGHDEEDSLWAHVAHQAEQAGFGTVDFADLNL